MKEIKFQDVYNWIFNLNKKKFTSAKKDADKKITRIKKTIDEIKTACLYLNDHANQSSETAKDVSIKSAKRFSEKVIERVEELEYPSKDELNYDKLIKFKMKFEKILRGDFYNQIGKRFVRKLDKGFRQDIAEINYLLKDASHQFMDLQEFIEKKYKKIKIVEDSFERISRVEQIILDLSNLKTQKKEIEDKLQEIEESLETNKREKNELEKDSRFEELKKVKREIDQNNQKILNIFSPFRKSLKKYSKRARLNGLEDYVLDPINAFLKDTSESTQFKAIINNLKEAINTKELKLKSSDERKTLKKIEEFLSRKKLDDLREFAHKKQDELTKLQKNLENSGLYVKFESLERKIQELEREKKEVEVTLNKINDDNDRILENIANNISTIEEMVYKMSKDRIKIVME
ncbi:MAG: coiled-coil domain-containing protein [Candidatus Helarchaeota archaeon]